MDYVIYTFSSTNEAFLSESLVKNANIKARLAPLPSEIDASCGLCLRFEKKYYKEVAEIFEKENFAYQGRYILSYKDDERKAKVLKYDLPR